MARLNAFLKVLHSEAKTARPLSNPPQTALGPKTSAPRAALVVNLRGRSKPISHPTAVVKAGLFFFRTGLHYGSQQ